MQRQGTISNTLMQRVLSHLQGSPFMRHLQGCLPDGYVRQNQRTGDIYWNSRDANASGRSFQHLSFHNGGTHNARGAVHLVYELPEQGRNITIRVWIYPMQQTESDPGWTPFGNYIWVDKTPMGIIHDEDEWLICNYIIDQVGHCLNQFFSPMIDGLNRSAGTRKSKKRKRRTRKQR